MTQIGPLRRTHIIVPEQEPVHTILPDPHEAPPVPVEPEPVREREPEKAPA